MDLQALDVCKETGLLNTYTLTKYMTEQLISEYHNQKFPVCIVRPSLVGSIAYHPTPGYFGNSAGSTAYLLAYGMGTCPPFWSCQSGSCYSLRDAGSITDLTPSLLTSCSFFLPFISDQLSPFFACVMLVLQARQQPQVI